MKELTIEDVCMVSGGAGVSGETIGCAVGGALGASGGVWGSAAGCLLGAYVGNNAGSWGSALGSAINNSPGLNVQYMIR